MVGKRKRPIKYCSDSDSSDSAAEIKTKINVKTNIINDNDVISLSSEEECVGVDAKIAKLKFFTDFFRVDSKTR